jgi:hypothetical protein
MFFRFLATSVAQTCEGTRVALTSDNGADNSHAGNSGNIRDCVMHANVHLIEALLHSSDPVRALINNGIALSNEGAQATDVVAGPERTT